jgi:hypothetical protein
VACGGKSSSSSSSASPPPSSASTGASAPPASSSATDPCSLVTKTEAEDALGGPSNPPKKIASPSGGSVKVCSYFSAAGKLPIKFVQVSVSKFPTASGKSQFAGLKKISPGAKDVAGIGEAAFASKIGTNTKVTVLKGESVVSVTGPDEASATKLVKAALGRM